jgi:hypothetical protein
MKLIKDFFFLNLNNYENIDFPFPIGMFLIFFTVAMCVMCFILNYTKSHTTALLKQLMRHKAFDEESAKTLAELRLPRSLAIRMALSQSGQISYLVQRAGYVKPTYEDCVKDLKKKGGSSKIDFDSEKFYLDVEKIGRAKKIVETDKTSVLKPYIFSVIFIAILVTLMFLLPGLLEAVNNALK